MNPVVPEEDNGEPSVDSNDQAERIKARRLRIEKRKETKRKYVHSRIITERIHSTAALLPSVRPASNYGSRIGIAVFTDSLFNYVRTRRP